MTIFSLPLFDGGFEYLDQFRKKWAPMSLSNVSTLAARGRFSRWPPKDSLKTIQSNISGTRWARNANEVSIPAIFCMINPLYCIFLFWCDLDLEIQDGCYAPTWKKQENELHHNQGARTANEVSILTNLCTWDSLDCMVLSWPLNPKWGPLNPIILFTTFGLQIYVIEATIGLS